MTISRSRRHGWLMSATVLATGMGFASAALAQTADPRPSTVEEIVVTARKQSETLQSVPLTVTALSSEAIAKLQVRSLYDLMTVTPGLSFGTTGGRNGINKLQIRNTSTGTSGVSKASVFVDGVYFAGDFSSAPIANLERVEVLKGPQSAAYGRSTFTGAVNFITRDPTDRLTARLDASAATYGHYDVTGYVGAPIVAGLLSDLVSFRYYDFRGPDAWTNADGYHLGDQKTFSIANKLVFTPAENLKVKLYTSYSKDDDHISATHQAEPSQRNLRIVRPDGTISYFYTGETAINFARPDYRMAVNGYIDDPGLRREQFRYALHFEYEVGGHTLSGFASTNHEKFVNNYDIYGNGFGTILRPNAQDVLTAQPYSAALFRAINKTTDKQFEIRITSPQEQRLRYMVAYNFTELFGRNINMFPTVSPTGVRNPYAIGANTDNWASVSNPAKDNSIFGGVYFDVTDKLTVSAEVRRQWEKVSSTDFLANTYRSAQFNSTLPRVNIKYQVTPDLQVYGVWAKGNNPGGFNTSAPAAVIIAAGLPTAYGEETITNYEAGVKSTWFGGRLLFNAAVYQMDWKNQQVPQSYQLNFPVPGNPSVLITTAAQSRIRGFEAEMQAAPMRGLNLRGTLSYGDAKYQDYCSSNYATVTGIADGPGCRYVNGNTHDGAPAWQGSLSADWTQPLTGAWDYFVRADYQYAGKVYNEEFNFSWTGPTNLINAHIGIENQNYSLELFGRNLTNEDTALRTFRFVDNRAAGGVYPAIPSPIGLIPAGAAGNQNLLGYPRTPRQVGVRVVLKLN